MEYLVKHQFWISQKAYLPYIFTIYIYYIQQKIKKVAGNNFSFPSKECCDSAVSVEIQLGGVTLDCRRNIREHSLQSNGNAIRLDMENVSRAYMVDISLRVFVEEDPANRCRDYPNL